jgi:phage terminase large subunit-like protein
MASPATRIKWCNDLGPDKCATQDWWVIKDARDKQLPPTGDWTYWLIMAGRGFGKTRTGSETMRLVAPQVNYTNIIGATADDARDIMIEGESGILSVCSKDERPAYRPSKRRLEWPSGAISLIFTADEPERLRGKQHGWLWADEIGSWRYPEAWDQAMFGLRLGDNPQAIITTTPRPIQIIKDLITNEACRVVTGTTYENKDNLADAFFAEIIRQYEGTRLGRQELLAEILDDNPDALWKRSDIKHVDAVPAGVDLVRILVGVDPAVTANKHSAETGIVVVALGSDGNGYVLGDYSLRASPDSWAHAVSKEYHDHEADRVIGEVNNGGDLVETNLRTVDPNISYAGVRATRGKYTRAEPIAALYEQGRVYHVGRFDELEQQMCQWNPLEDVSPDRLDALVWGVTKLGLTNPGLSFYDPADDAEPYPDTAEGRADEVAERMWGEVHAG